MVEYQSHFARWVLEPIDERDGRYCPKCREIRPGVAFGRNGGRHSERCKACGIRQDRKRCAEDARADGDDVKECRDCKLALPLASFKSAPRYADGLSSQCKFCERIESAERRLGSDRRAEATRAAIIRDGGQDADPLKVHPEPTQF